MKDKERKGKRNDVTKENKAERWIRKLFAIKTERSKSTEVNNNK